MNKAENKWPFIQWFVRDWLADPKVSLCDATTRGILFDWLCNMHALDRSGSVTGTREILAQLGRCTILQCDAALQTLIRTNAAEVQERNGLVTVTNRRMKRESEVRKHSALRVKRHRGREPCNAEVTLHMSRVQSTELKGQSSQLGTLEKRNLTKLTLSRSALGRIASEIIGNAHGWVYDNCKVQPGMFPYPKSLITVLAAFVGRIPEHKVHVAWQEAVRRAHGATVDGLAENPPRYAITCWREALEKECAR